MPPSYVRARRGRTSQWVNPMQYIENKTFDELNVGDRAELTRTLRKEDIELFAVMSGDVNPAWTRPSPKLINFIR